MATAETTKKETQVETVTMKDGKIVDFAGKRKMLKETTIGADGTVTTRLDFRNGEFRVFTIPAAMLAKFAGHGAEQKLGDETAGLDDVGDCVLAVDELIDRLYNGEWSIKREGSGMAGTSILLKALVEHTGKTVEQIKRFLSGDPTAVPPVPAKTQAEKIALRNNPKIKPIIERLESEKVSKGPAVDTDALLAGLDS